MTNEIKLRANKVVEMCMFESDGYTLNKDYENAKLLVFDGLKLIVSENLKDVLFSTIKMLKEYEVIKWTTDWKVSGSEKIRTLVLFVEKVSA